VEKVGLIRRLIKLSKPTGGLQWTAALKTILVMILAAILAKFLGLDNGIKAIMITSLMAAIILDNPLPIRKIIPLGVLGAIMISLAYMCAYLALSGLPIFIFFTVLWAFFTLSMYIFGESDGFFGFILFASYFSATIIINNQSTIFEWPLYCIFAFLVASLILIPKIWHRNTDIRKMLSAGFIPQNPLRNVIATQRALTDIPLKPQLFQLFRAGLYFKGFRGYAEMILSHLSEESRDVLTKFLKSVDETSLKTADHIIHSRNTVDLSNLEHEFKEIETKAKLGKISDLNVGTDISRNFISLLRGANNILKKIDLPSKKSENLKISPETSFRETLEANFNLNNMYIRHALRFSLAMTVALLFVHLTHNRDAIWVAMGVLIIIKPDISSTMDNMLLRVFFNVLGIIVAIILGILFPHHVFIWLAFLMLFFFRLFLPNFIGPSVMALTIFVVLIWPTGTVFENAVARLLDIFIGGIIAFIFAYVILPSRVTVNLPVQLAKTLKANGSYIKSVFMPYNKYNHANTVKKFKNLILEHNNLEAAIKKLQDSFRDVNEDVESYQDILAANQKLAADVTGIAALLERDMRSFPVLSLLGQFLSDSINEIAESVIKGIKPVNLGEMPVIQQKVDKDEDYTFHDLEQLLKWTESDIKFIHELIKNAAVSNVIQRYRNLI